MPFKINDNALYKGIKAGEKNHCNFEWMIDIRFILNTGKVLLVMEGSNSL